MIEPCGTCPDALIFVDTQIEGEAILAELDEHKRALWLRYFNLKQESPGEAGLPIDQVAEVLTVRSYVETEGPLIVGAINHFTLSVRSQTQQCVTMECGIAPESCPRLISLQTLHERIKKDADVLKAKTLGV